MDSYCNRHSIISCLISKIVNFLPCNHLNLESFHPLLYKITNSRAVSIACFHHSIIIIIYGNVKLKVIPALGPHKHFANYALGHDYMSQAVPVSQLAQCVQSTIAGQSSYGTWGESAWGATA